MSLVAYSSRCQLSSTFEDLNDSKMSSEAFGKQAFLKSHGPCPVLPQI